MPSHYAVAVALCCCSSPSPPLPFFTACLAFQSLTAALIASSANILQCNFTGGRLKCFAMSLFLIVRTSSTGFPFTHSVATLLEAMADPQPNVLKHESTMLPSSSTLIWSFMTSPQAGAPTKPVPTLGSFLSKLPTLRGRS